MNLLQQFLRYIEHEKLFQPKEALLLAISGGLDSVVLCELCYQAGFDFVIAHANFQLRGEESKRDETFVRELAEKYQKRVFIGDFETKTYAFTQRISVQVAARELRYQWFNELLNAKNPEAAEGIEYPVFPVYIATAHHRDDNVETMLMNFFKGTGIAGLRGMLPRQGKIVRPLLFAPKEALLSFAKQNHLPWVEDSSNESDKYTRNYVRHQVIPLVENLFPQVMDNLSDNIHRFRDIELLYHQSISEHKKQLLEHKGPEVHIPILKLRNARPLSTIVYEIIKDYHFSVGQTEEVISLLDSASGKYINSSTHRVLKNRKWLIISPLHTHNSQHILIEGPGHWPMGNKQLQLEIISAAHWKLLKQDSIGQVDADKVQYPLLLRKWKQGDYFYPFGMQKKKKLNRFFIDNKLSQVDKENTWVLEMDKKIIWVVGMRIDDRFKITEHTQHILKIQVGMA